MTNSAVKRRCNAVIKRALFGWTGSGKLVLNESFPRFYFLPFPIFTRPFVNFRLPCEQEHHNHSI